MKTPSPPSHLSLRSQALWARIHREYQLEAEAVELLRVALENLDLADQARQLLRDEGLVIEGRKHPASDAVKLHDGMFLRALRQLGLDIVGPGQPAGKRA